MADSRTANLLGALVLALDDEVSAATAAAAEHGATFPAALVSLRWEPGLSIETLRRRLGLTHSGTVRLLDRLEADGLVARHAGPDGRTVALGLTARGRRSVRAILDRREDVLQRTLRTLSRGELGQLTTLLEKLLAGMTTDPEQADRICRLCDEGVCDAAACPVERAARG